LKKLPLPANEVREGDKDVILGHFEVMNRSAQPVRVDAFTVRNKEKSNRIGNIRASLGKCVVPSYVTGNGVIIFAFWDMGEDGKYGSACLKRNDTEEDKAIVMQNEGVELMLIGDIVASQGPDEVAFEFYNSSLDFLVVGEQSGYGGKVMYEDDAGELSDRWNDRMEQTLYIR
jgi:hypothetical protein